MKKLIVAISFLFTALFCGCLTQSEPKDLFKVPISITARLDGNNAEFTADVFESGSDIVFGSEHALSGTVIHFRDDGNTAVVGDIFTRDIKNGTFPAQETLIKAIRLLSSTDVTGVPDGERTRYTIDEMTILVYYDKKTDSVTRIETEEGEKRFAFVIASLEPHDTQSSKNNQSQINNA